ncbi:Flagellar hook protein FlgE [hydrothermal vent metagenome]|uniref:Flagellar hook protein FlgE n=1 Tax=hydrothermal vent metagenome TaxID=652676 RepID=A0A1W1D5L3_9ZZZZ
MLKSLFSGVSGLQSHQVAMDVESNNIANVNTVGFKYSRTNFSDLLAQTKSIATAPQGSLGGKNPVQVGLGATTTSMTRIFSQGSVQNSDKNTDMAIQGDGFFIISPDGGNTYKYTRSGDFKFDASGNFVDNNGFTAQGWMRDPATGKVDSTAPITNINIPPGLTTPANPTAEVNLKANLNSGPLVTNFSPAYSVPSGSPEAPFTSAQPAVDQNGNPIASGDIGVMFNDKGEAFSLQRDQGVWISFQNAIKDDSNNVQSGAVELDATFTLDDGTTTQITTTGGKASNTAAENGNRFASAINDKTGITGIRAKYDAETNKIILTNDNSSSSASHNIRLKSATGGSGLVAGNVTTAYTYTYDPTSSSKLVNSNKTFTSMADLREAMEVQARDPDGNGTQNNIQVIVNEAGKFEVSNPGGSPEDYAVDLKVTPYISSDVTENTKFTQSMSALNSTLPVGSGGKALSQSFNAATHSASIDVFDSLGSKHTLRMEFRKTQLDTKTGSTWDMTISVPPPATIDSTAPLNEKKGSIRFNSDGSLATFDPPTISFSANNGSSSDQQIALKLGSSSEFNGMTSFDSTSTTSGISQDGYTGGDLVGIRIDQSGTLIGSFSNGRSFGLAQVAMAKFTNNEGLATDGGNVYSQTANSGDPIIGTAATAGRGFIQSSALEASNVDLSRALTQLIIVQRGFQANGKTITTSDQLLQTLIGLKN